MSKLSKTLSKLTNDVVLFDTLEPPYLTGCYCAYWTRLNYTMQYCEGKANDFIKHCFLSEPEKGYYKTLELLEEAFVQWHVVVWTFINKLMEFPNVRNDDAALLRKLSHEMQACELTLSR